MRDLRKYADASKALGKGMLLSIWYSYVQFVLILSFAAVHYLLYGVSKGFDICVTSVFACMVFYTFTFFILKALIPGKAIVPALISQFLLMITVWLYIVYEQDWNFRIVTIDKYMITGWTSSLYCIALYLIRGLIFKLLENRQRALKYVRLAFNSVIVLVPIVLVLGLVIIRCIESAG